MLINDLKLFGLEEKEASIYLALLELGSANIQQISKKSKVKRTTVYDIIESLKAKGMVSATRKSNKILFVAAEPAKLEEELECKKTTLKKIMPELLSIANVIGAKPKIKFYEGEEGIKEVYRDTLKYPQSELLAWVAEAAVTAFDEEFLNDYYLPKRVKNKIWVRAIAPDKKYMQKYKGLDQKSLRTTKLIDAEQFPLNVEINLYGKNKIAIMSFTEKMSLIIESREIFTTLTSIFESQWSLLAR